MRLDLYLKTSRIVKRRAVAQAMCDAGRVLVNGKAAKPAKEVKVGDVVALAFPSKIVEIEVLAMPEKGKKPAVGGDAAAMKKIVTPAPEGKA